MLALIRRHADFVGNVSTLAAGRGVAVALSFLLTPVVARLFSPEHFGLAALFAAIVKMAGTVATLRYDRAIPLPDNERAAASLMTLSLRVAAGACALLLVVPGTLWALELELPFMQALGPWLWLVPVGVMLGALALIVEGWLVRTSAYRPLAHADIQQSLWTSVSRLGAGFALGSSAWALIGGYLLGKLARLATLVHGAPAWPRPTPADRRVRLRAAAIEYREFPFFNAPTTLVRSFSQSIPVLLLGVWFEPAVVGLFAMGNRLVRVPLELLATSVRRVFLQRAAALHNAGTTLRGAFSKLTAALALLGALPMAALSLGGDALFVLLLGERWREAGAFAALLAPWLFMIVVSIPAVATLIVLRKQALWLRIELVVTALRLAAFVAAARLADSPGAAVLAFAWASMLANLAVVGVVHLRLEHWESESVAKHPAGDGARRD
ncbi:MAG: lipopolysaccharide biosynthesis protein [Pseudomonadota bacterium]